MTLAPFFNFVYRMTQLFYLDNFFPPVSTNQRQLNPLYIVKTGQTYS